MTVLGAPLDRVDGRAKTTGQARFSTEYAVPRLAYAAVVHATVARGRITALDTTAADLIPGVIQVITHLNAPPLKPTPKQSMTNMVSLAPGTRVNYLNTDEVHFDGQPIAVVVAESIESAEQAARAVEVRYDQLAAEVDFGTEFVRAKDVPSSPLGTPPAGQKGDAEKALAESAYSVDNVFSTPAQNHNAMEPHATTAVWDGDRLTVYEGSQNIDWVGKHLADKFGVPAANVRVISTFTGGAFGGRTMVWPGTVLAVLAARVTGRPIRLMLSREGVYRTVGGRTPTRQRIALGADSDGRLTSLIHFSTTLTGKVGGGPEQVVSCSRDLYDAPNILLASKSIELDLVPNTVMRAPGESVGTFALETSIDELAYRAGLDPIELRLRNQPVVGPLDKRKFSHHSLPESLKLGAELFGWQDRTAAAGSMRDGDHLIGWGVAAAFHPSWQFPANLVLGIDDTGRATVRCGFHEMGMGSATATAQMAAHLLGLRADQVTVEYGDTALPTGPGAGGSGQTASIAASLLQGCEKLVDSVHSMARRSTGSPLRRTSRSAVEARDGGLFVAGAGEGYGAILQRAGRQSVEVKVGSDTGMGALAGQLRFMTKMVLDGRRWMKAASGAQFCEVRIDRDTGETRVTRWVGVFDVGRVVNAKTAASQLRGGIVMGLGLALTEATLVDRRTGRIMNPSLTEYHVPVHADVPAIEVHCLDDPDPTMPLGVLGAGEVGITGAGAAVANAIFHATGRRVRDLPITLDTVLS